MTNTPLKTGAPVLDRAKFRDPERTAAGDVRASVALGRLETLWINTGTLCNLACDNCYIESSPTNDRLSYISADEVAAYLDEIESLDLGTSEIGFTGGEPFMNPDFLAMTQDALERGHDVLILTNAMRPMLNRRAGLLQLQERHPGQIKIRVSIDHYARTLHELLRGPGSWDPMIEGLRWLAGNAFEISVAGRTIWHDGEARLRDGYARLFRAEGIEIDAADPHALVLFPEMDPDIDVPEITTACWSLLDVDPGTMMCASSRMVVKRKGAESPGVVSCTLLPYDEQFELGDTLAEALTSVRLNHPHCARFCVLGGASCSG